MSDEIDKLTAARDGWRSIAEALLALAFDAPLKGFGDIPPVEVVEQLAATGEPERLVIIDRLRDALLGRAWHVRGSKGAGTCDYPLCPHRGEAGAPALSGFTVFDSQRNRATLRVCEAPNAPDDLGECYAWAQWVAERASSGQLRLRTSNY